MPVECPSAVVDAPGMRITSPIASIFPAFATCPLTLTAPFATEGISNRSSFYEATHLQEFV